MIILAVTTDGRRECLEQTIPSLLEHVSGLDGPRVIFDDSGDRGYQHWLRRTFEKQGFVVTYGRERVGQGRAIDRAWKFLARKDFRHQPWVWWQEDDFLFDRDVHLAELTAVMEARPYLQQIALLRQPWFPSEKRAGGIVEKDPGEYSPVTDGDRQWLEHRRWFTLNPCLFRRELCGRGWPTHRAHEWAFSRKLADEDPEFRFAYWGDGTPWITHIGEERVGRGY